MIEAYAFLAAFTIQILAMSVLYPAWFIRRARLKVASIPAELLAQLYPGVDVSRERSLTLYRALNTAIAVLGVLLLVWLFNYTQRIDWNEHRAAFLTSLTGLYFLLQALPIGFIAWWSVRFNKMHMRALPEGKRKAILQRRGLFDFVSPFVVFLAALGYFPFAAYMIYLRLYPFPEPVKPLFRLGAVTFVYAWCAFCVYGMLYGRKRNPLQTQADRVHAIGLGVRICVYPCILAVVFVALVVTIEGLGLERWKPFAESVFFVINAVLLCASLTAPPRQPDADGLGSSPVLPAS